MGILTRTKVRIVFTIPNTSFPGEASTILMFKMAMQKFRSDTTTSLARAVVGMTTSLVTRRAG